MKKDNTKLENINTLLKKRVITPTAIMQDDGNQLLPGQVWKTNSKSEKFPFVMILEEIEKDQSYNVAPIFRWTEKAGPEDLFIPNNFVGTPMIISFELEFSISTESLKNCKGILESKELAYILAARDSLEKGKIDNKTYTWGWQYLDKYDNRYQYHEMLAVEIEKLQSLLLKQIYSPEPNAIPFKKQNCISFNEFLDNKLAADAVYTGRKLLSESWICPEPESEWLLSETEAGDKLSFELESGDVESFQDALILDSNGSELGKVHNGIAALKLDDLLKTKEHFFALQLPDGKHIEFIKKDQ